jgi:hypothetical protein
MVDWGRALRKGVSPYGQPEHYQLPEQGETAYDCVALRLLRACCTNYWEAEEAVLAYFDADDETRLAIDKSMVALVADARKAVVRAVLFDGEDIPTTQPAKAVAAEDVEQTTPVTRAIALLLAADRDDRPWNVSELASAVGVHKSTLYRDPHFNALVKALRAKGGAAPPHGQKDAEGNIDAWDEDE